MYEQGESFAELRLRRVESTSPGAARTSRAVHEAYKADRARLALRDYVRLTPRNGRYTEGCACSGAFSKTRCWRCKRDEKRSPFSRQAEGAHWWRRRDSRFRLFRDGLDYAFIPQSLVQLRERGVLSGSSLRILVPALVSRRQPVYESLQGGPEVGPLSTPRRYRCRRHRRRWPAPSGFADVSPVVTSPSRVKATLLDRTRVRKHYATGHYMLSPFFDSRHALPEGQGRRTASYRAF
jgi:hypothetical protein